ncbi:MAG TPA: iron-sulfur cluster assembly accessory protein [Planctomycetaceae bacterium]|nr:iron-sulfur cluster assembly accessory protein [Planctomycetaceae bacterium]
MTVTITEKAAAEMLRVFKEQNLPEGTVLRVGVVGGGCSGFQYSLGFDKAADPENDEISEQHGITVAVDKRSAVYLQGTTIDFYDGLERRGFTFDNPNAARNCGCGNSFSV